MSQQGVVRLKELLFDRERREIDILAERLNEVAGRVGSDAQLQRSVAQILEGAIREAEADPSRHRELADALAPLMLRTIRTEVDTASERLPARLYPHIGRMVRDYVTSAIRDLMEDINRRLESGLVNNRLMLKLRSWTSGRSMAELALADSARLDVEELHLIERRSGRLLAHWNRDGAPEPAPNSNRGALFSGLLSALTAFIDEVYEPDKASLRTIDFGDHTLYLRGAPGHLLVARCRGEAGAGMQQILDEEFVRALDDATGSAALRAGTPPDLVPLATRLDRHLEARRREIAQTRSGARPLKWLLTLLALMLIGVVGWQSFVGWRTSRLQAAANAVIAADPALKGYPTEARVARGGGAIVVSGLAPSGAARERLLTRLQAIAPDAVITEAVSVIPGDGAGETAQEVARLRRSMSDLEAEARRAAERRVLERVRLRLDRMAAELAALAEPARGDQALVAALQQARASAAASAEEVAMALDGAAPHSHSRTLDRLRATEGALQRLLVAGSPAHVAVVPVPATRLEGSEELALVTERIGALVTALAGELARRPMASELAESRRSLAETRQEIAALRAMIDALANRPAPAVAPDPRLALDLWTRTHAIFFRADAAYRDPEEAAAALDRLADLMRAVPAVVRVVGHTDERGGQARNNTLAQTRAEAVAADLVRRGIARDRIVVLARAAQHEISPRAGADSPNRRVTFEIAFEGETRAAP